MPRLFTDPDAIPDPETDYDPGDAEWEAMMAEEGRRRQRQDMDQESDRDLSRVAPAGAQRMYTGLDEGGEWWDVDPYGGW